MLDVRSLRPPILDIGEEDDDETPDVAAPPEGRPWGAWIGLTGTNGDQDSRDGYIGHDYRTNGSVFGLDYRLNPNVLIGATGGTTDTDIDLDWSRGDGDISSYFGSLYGTWFTPWAYVEGIASFGRSEVDSKRRVRVGSIMRQARANYDSSVWSGFTEAGLRVPVLKRSTVEPFGSLSYIRLVEDGFNESGAGSANMNVGGRNTDSLRSALGVRLQSRRRGTRGLWIGELSTAWSHDFDIDDRALHTGYQGAIPSAFSLDGRNVARNGVLVGANLSLNTTRGVNISLNLGLERRARLTNRAARLEVSLPF
jgi:outer membrane autotransporter protein